ncbi:MAG: magnesium transporter [Erysipelotrichaceae bacterium]|nr:magnesium transporter [Erysipelotrichaceae bacterium]
MAKEHSTNPEYVERLVKLLSEDISAEDLETIITNYHACDIADALEELTGEQRKKIYAAVSDEELAEIFAYLEEVGKYIEELPLERAAEVVSWMDSDDAVDVLEEIDDTIENKIVDLMDDESSEDVKLIQSYNEEEIGSKMTTNYVVISNDMTVKQAMKSLVEQARDNDNISTLYVVDRDEKFYGAINLPDLIIARADTPLESIITNSYPTVYDHEKVSDLLADLQDYAEDSFPVLDKDDHILGIITAQDIIEATDEELGEDYAKLAGLSGEEDLHEKTFTSVKKRIPWLIVLLVLGLGVSSVVGTFEHVVDLIPLLFCFQSLILDMAGNVGTQSLAVTIRVLTDEDLSVRDKLGLVLKEIRVGMFNGLILGTLVITFITVYIMLAKGQPFGHSLLISLCVAAALVLAMIISSFIGTIVPLILHRINIDPAVASGPLITTINDLVAVVSYYSLAWLLLVDIFKLYR